ncbi:hypothetical protein [Paenibacillus tepidiphilus]|uniref:hypothetical protein n=1 Tax=Paenibacillus tepidiphilus TaxID=2608683 RepID=UPI00123976C3|nr:hypothetical protein [Paenibacillus tepidiphilus]
MNRNHKISAALLLTFALAAGITAVSAAPAALSGSSRSPQVAEAVTTVHDGEVISDGIKEQLALQWAEAWKTRDGQQRLEIMSGKLQEEYRNLQALETGDPDNNVIRWSSPWVVDYTVQSEGDTSLITYRYTDSTGTRYEGRERLSYGEENGQAVIIQSETIEEMKQL